MNYHFYGNEKDPLNNEAFLTLGDSVILHAESVETLKEIEDLKGIKAAIKSNERVYFKVLGWEFDWRRLNKFKFPIIFRVEVTGILE